MADQAEIQTGTQKQKKKREKERDILSSKRVVKSVETIHVRYRSRGARLRLTQR